MLDKVTKDDFSALVGEVFVARDVTGSEFAFTLTEVTASRFPKGPAARREPFSLLFRGPEGIFIGQGTIPLRHPRLGEQPMPMFLVPVGRDMHADERLLYQAIFS